MQTSNIFFIFVITLIASFSVESRASDKKIEFKIIEKSYQFEGAAGRPAQNIKIQIQYTKPRNVEELREAKAWLRLAEEKHRVAPQHRYTVNFGEQNIARDNAILVDRSEPREELHVPVSRFQQIKGWFSKLTGENTRVGQAKKKFDDFAYKFSNDQVKMPIFGRSISLNYLPTLALARGSVNGTVISLSFIASGLDHQAAWITGMTLGAISGAIQYKIKPFSDFLEKKGWIHGWYKRAMGKYIYLSSLYSGYRSGLGHELAKEAAKAVENSFMNLKFSESALYNANMITKWWAVEVGILGLADIMFRVMGSPLEADIMSSVSAVLITSTVATFGQGIWDFAFITDKAKREEALKNQALELERVNALTEEAQTEIDKGYSKVKFGLAIKAFTISVTSNIAAALMLTGNDATSALATTMMTGLSVAGASYYGYIQYKYNDGLRLKIQQVKTRLAQSCSSFLEKALPPPAPLLPGINFTP